MVSLLVDVLVTVGRNIGKFVDVRLEGCVGLIPIAIEPGAVEILAIQYNV
jgi:hypothetical protein